jgi:hypothetical protein
VLREQMAATLHGDPAELKAGTDQPTARMPAAAAGAAVPAAQQRPQPFLPGPDSSAAASARMVPAGEPPSPSPSPFKTRSTAYRATISSTSPDPPVLAAAHSSPAASLPGEPQPEAASALAVPTAAKPSPAESNESVAKGSWRDQLAVTLEQLEKELADVPRDSRSAGTLAAMSRLLHVIANHSDSAVAGIDHVSDDEREFWKHQAMALLLALDVDQKNVAGRRAALALRELRSAVDHLANISSLDVRNLALVKEVVSYGQLVEFPSQSFRPEAEVLLYVEIDNFTAQPAGDQFETELQGSYDIEDAAGTRITSVQLPLDKKLCNNRRRDYFIAYLIHLPRDLAPGQYTLHLTMEDVKGHKSSRGSVDFRIRN